MAADGGVQLVVSELQTALDATTRLFRSPAFPHHPQLSPIKKYWLLKTVLLHTVTFRTHYVVRLLYGKLCAITRRVGSTMPLF